MIQFHAAVVGKIFAESGGKRHIMPVKREAQVSRRAQIIAVPAVCILGAMLLRIPAAKAKGAKMLIDDFTDPELTSKLGTSWRGVSDRVMGGVSQARVTHVIDDGQPSLALGGDVRLENNGGFIQASLNLAPALETFDASGCRGLRLLAQGNGEAYSVHLRTPDAVHPWQSYRANFVAGAEWRSIEVPFTEFTPYKLEPPLDTRRLKRIGIVAIGRAFTADIKLARLEFYR
jgi:hypothetical protein